MQRELQDAEGIGVRDLAVGSQAGKSGVVRAARAHDELTYSVRIRQSCGRLLSKSLVDVIVAVEHDIGMSGVQKGPQRQGAAVGPAAGAERGDVPVSEGALIRVGREIRGKPLTLGGLDRAPAGRGAVGIEGD